MTPHQWSVFEGVHAWAKLPLVAWAPATVTMAFRIFTIAKEAGKTCRHHGTDSAIMCGYAVAQLRQLPSSNINVREGFLEVQRSVLIRHLH